MATRIATAEWADPALVEEKYLYSKGDVWLGRAPGSRQLPIGYTDDRHVCLVSGSRSGKGTSSIINNLCLWPGSVVVVDPKGENATITVPRRGKGSEKCEGLGQRVHVLDPFKAAQVDDSYRSRFNPLDALNPDNEETIDEAGRIADAIVVIHESNDPFWDESARAMVKGLILHVLTSEDYEGRRNLITVRQLILRGDWEGIEALRECGETEFPPAHGLLWTNVGNNAAFGGLVAGIGESFANMLRNSPKQYESVLQVANRNTEFIDSPAMQRCLEASDFDLSELKTKPEGMSLYVCLPQRYVSTHYRWLRMMIALTVAQMEIVRGRPVTGFPVLMVLDEFAGLKRMEVIENAVAQIAGFGVKLFFVLQSLEQLKAAYKNNWETFLSNSGLKIFFGLDDHFSREYVSKLVGDTELVREVRSSSDSVSESESHGHTTGSSVSRSRSVSEGTNRSSSDSVSSGVTSGVGETRGSSRGESWSPAGFFDLIEKDRHQSEGRSRSTSRTQGSSRGRSHSVSSGVSHGTSDTYGTTTNESDTVTRGTSRSRTTGASETLHRRPLVSPDEIGHLFARIDDTEHGSYPGLALIVISGERAVAVRRVNYFDDYEFAGRFEPHADYPAPLPCKDISIPAKAIVPYQEFFTFDNVAQLLLDGWLVKPGQIVGAGEPVVRFQFQKAFLHVKAPHSGMIAAVPEGKPKEISELFSLRYYETDEPETDPFGEIAAYCKTFTNAIRDGLGKATMSAWLMGGLGVLFVGLAIAARNWIFLAPAAFVAYRAFRAAAKVSAHKRILERYPDGVPVNDAARNSWKTLELSAGGVAQEGPAKAESAELVSRPEPVKSPDAPVEGGPAPAEGVRAAAPEVAAGPPQAAPTEEQTPQKLVTIPRASEGLLAAARKKRVVALSVGAVAAVFVLVMIGVAFVRKGENGGSNAGGNTASTRPNAGESQAALTGLLRAAGNGNPSTPVVSEPNVSARNAVRPGETQTGGLSADLPARPETALPSAPARSAASVPEVANLTPAPPNSAPEPVAPVASSLPPPALPAAATSFQPVPSNGAVGASPAAALPAVPAYSGPSSGKLSYNGPPVPQNGEIVFSGLPPGKLDIVFDTGKWDAHFLPGDNGRQRLVLRSKRPGTQNKAEVTWSISK